MIGQLLALVGVNTHCNPISSN